MKDEKYVVVKREEWEDHIEGDSLPDALEDAVVIRTGDVFAGPALHMYALSIATALKLSPAGPRTQDLQKIADYFHERAVEADEQQGHIPKLKSV